MRLSNPFKKKEPEQSDPYEDIVRLPPCTFQTKQWKRRDGIITGWSLKEEDFAIEV